MSQQWFVRAGGKVSGPHSAAELKHLFQSGKVQLSAEVASTASGPWRIAANLRGLIPMQSARSLPKASRSLAASGQSLTDALRAICAGVDGDDFYITSDLTHKQLKKVCQAFGVSSPDSLVAIIDGTAFKTGTRGLAICTDGIHWKNDFSVDTTKSYLSWEEFQSVEPMLTKEKHIDFGNAMVADLSDTAFPLLDIVPLLLELKDPKSSSRQHSATGAHPARRPRALKFAYKEAAGATFVCFLLCMVAAGFAKNYFWPKEKIVEKGVYAQSPSQQQPAATKKQPDKSAEETNSDRIRKKLVGRWAGTWFKPTTIHNTTGKIRMSINWSEGVASNGRNPKLAVMIQVFGRGPRYSEDPETSVDCIEIWEGGLYDKMIRFEFPNSDFKFSVKMDETGDSLTGSFLGMGTAPGSGGKITLLRQ